MSSKSRYRWLVVSLFFAFILLHQADKLLIRPLTTPIMETFAFRKTRMGAVTSGALLVSSFLYPLWAISSSSTHPAGVCWSPSLPS